MPKVRLRDIVKTLVRSRSLAFTRDIVRQQRTSSLGKIRWHDRDVYYRPGTTDPLVLQQILLKTGRKAEYYLPPRFQPEVILDIGSNIGAAILYFQQCFPKARIIGFEPHPDTFAVLQKNVANLSQVTVLNCGLGSANTQVIVPAESVNFGAFSTKGRARGQAEERGVVECEVRRLDDVLRELDIQKIDLIKIDCEGAEADVITGLSPQILEQCQWIVGELHDASAFTVLARLSPYFDIDLKKRMFSSLFRFHACNLSNIRTLREGLDIDALQR
ncbi:MAG TPA: FkbM family methyltransferase [Chthoniobacterales bacterium]|nr:FkbM family methyltransferase [Chthoniobacterales bacterium]